MARIFYSVSGEGRGHASRARALIEDLRKDLELVVYAPEDAFDFLAPYYQGSEVEVRRIPGLRFHYSPSRRLDYVRTGFGNAGYFWNLPGLVRRLTDEIRAGRPDLVITDFEPSLPLAARRAGVPFLSLDHQHFLVTADLKSLPAGLRRYAAFMAPFVHASCQGQVHTIVSSFYFPELKPGLQDVTQIGVLLRPEILSASPHEGGHVVAYLRRFAPPTLMEALRGCGVEVRVYGLGVRPSVGNLQFFDIDPVRFVDDLAASRALVSTAGNQLIGEALYLGKGVLALPEPGNREQEINAFFLRRFGHGLTCGMDAVEPSSVRELLERGPELASTADRELLAGNAVACELVARHAGAKAWKLPARRPRRLAKKAEALA